MGGKHLEAGGDQQEFMGVATFYNFFTGEERRVPCLANVNIKGDVDFTFSREEERKAAEELLETGVWFLLEVGKEKH